MYFELKLILFFRHCSKYILVFRSGPNLLNIFHRVLVHSDSNDEYKTELDSDCKCHFFQLLRILCILAITDNTVDFGNTATEDWKFGLPSTTHVDTKMKDSQIGRFPSDCCRNDPDYPIGSRDSLLERSIIEL